MPPNDAAPDATASKARFEALFANAPFSVQLLAADGRTLAVNRAWEDLWQAMDGLKDYVLREYNILEDPQLAAKGIDVFLRRAFQGESVDLPTILYDPAELGRAGRARWLKASAHPIKDPAGALREVLLIHEDVTDRTRAENALRASEMRLKQLANTIPQLAWMAEPDGAIHWYNDRWYEYTGTSPADMEGWGWQSVHDPAVLPSVVELWKRSIATGDTFQMTFPLRGRDGGFRPFFTLVAPLKDAEGKVVQWFGTNTDVSPLQEAQQALRATEERLRIATEAGDIGIWDWDVVDDRVVWSDRVYLLHGLESGGFGGKGADFAALLHPDDAGWMWKRIEAALSAGEGFSADFRIVLPDGTPRWLSTWARVHRRKDGVPERMVGATISIDAYKKAEATLVEADRRKDEFLAMLAHELRNPLAPITSAAHLLGLSVPDEKRIQFASEIIKRQARHMTELVDDLLDVSRVTRGLVQLKKEAVDVNSAIASAIEQVRPLVEERHHVLATWTDPKPVSVFADRTRLIQMIVNLLNNAAKYTPEGGEIALRIEAVADRVAIVVKDNGLGIEPAFLPHLFDLFSQGARTPDRAQGGLGIGLALVRSIVHLHGGEVEARSEGAGMGSTFTLWLPLAGKRPADEAPAQSTTAPRRPAIGLDILIVDDNLDAARSLAALLGGSGHRVTVSADAKGALEVPEDRIPRVFILDIGMPTMDGYELARRLRARPATAAAILIALTGYGHASDRELALSAGFDHHFVKPVPMEKLAAALAAAARGNAPTARSRPPKG